MDPLVDRRQAQRVANAYFAAMCAQSLDQLMVLFANDALIVWPDGRAIEGKSSIAPAYERIFAGRSNNPDPGSIMLGPHSFSTEVVSRFSGAETHRTINVFRLNDAGLIVRMDSYRQG